MQSLPVTPQTDIYALGVLLYELLVGGHPFPDTSPAELVVKHLQEPLPYVRDSKPELPAALDGVIQRATAKNPEARYPSASALAADYWRALQLEVEESDVPEEAIYNPYKGLRAFQEADADDFFGREALTGQLLAHLAAPGAAGRFLAVVGPSGSGKSSVVKAGLVPALRKGALPGSDQWYIVETHPGASPLQELQLALMSISADPGADIGELLKLDETGLLRAVQATLPGKDSQLLLVIDQFEELFILVEKEDYCNHYLEILRHAVSDGGGQVRVVFTLRADFYDRPLKHPAFGKLVEACTAVVLPLSNEELEQVIQHPAERVGTMLEKGLVQEIIKDVADQPGALPLLQYALTELFERRAGRMLTNQAYHSIGGVLGALGRRAEEVYSDLAPGGREVARQLFLRLVTLGEGAGDTRRQVQRSEVQSLFSKQISSLDQVVDAFGKARLLSFDHDPVSRAPTVEVAHEALLSEWRRLVEWLDQDRADIRMQRVLGNAANEWLISGHESSYLLRGSRLDQFEAWEETSNMPLTHEEQEYLETSLAERREREAMETERLAREAAAERRSRNFLRGLVAVMAVAAVVAIVLSIYAFNQQGLARSEADQRATQQAVAESEAKARATQQAIAEEEAQARGIAEEQALEDRDRAVEAEQDALEQGEEALHQAAIGLASQAELQAKGRAPETSVLLALEAQENYPYTWQAERALGNAILNNRLRMVMQYDFTFQGVEWSSDGSKILIGGIKWDEEGKKIDANAHVLDASTGEELLRITEGTNMANWSPDERSILAFNEDDVIVRVWDVESRTTRLTLDENDIGGGLNMSYADWEPWSPNGDRFLIFNTNGLVKIFDTHSGEVLQTLSGHEGELSGDQFRRVDQVMWSPKGDLVAVLSTAENIVVIYQAYSGEALYTIPLGFENSDGTRFGSWSPSGDRFVIRGWEGTKVYETATGRQLLDLSVPQNFCVRVVWSADGSHILTIDNPESVTVWDAESGQELLRIRDVVFVLHGDLSPSGDLAAIADGNGSVNVWDVASGQVMHKLSGTFGYATWVQFSPDGERLLALGDDNMINILDLTEASFSIPISTCLVITQPAWSPDNQQIAFTANCPPDYPVKIWDANSGEKLFELPTQNDAGDVIWSPSGDRILITYLDSRFMVWDALSFELLYTFTGQEGEVWVSEWSPDGSQIATGYTDGTVVVWDSSNGEEIITFVGHTGGQINSARWSPDGSRLMSTNDQGEAIIWDAATGKVLLELFSGEFKNAVPDSAWTKDGERVVIFSTDGYVRIFDSTTGDKIFEFFTRSGSSITHFSLSPNGERMVIGGNDSLATVWDVATGVEIINYEVDGYVWPTYSPDGSQVLIGSTEGQWGKLQVFPVWDSLEDLTEYAKECCVVRELTPGERDVFGLPPAD